MSDTGSQEAEDKFRPSTFYGDHIIMVTELLSAPECIILPEPPKPAHQALPTLAAQKESTSPPPLLASRPDAARSSSSSAGKELEIYCPKVSLLNSPALPKVPALTSAPGARDLLTPPKSPAEPSEATSTSPGKSHAKKEATRRSTGKSPAKQRAARGTTLGKSPAKRSAATSKSHGIAKPKPASVLNQLGHNALTRFVRAQRHALFKMVVTGVIAIHPDVVVRVGLNGSLEVDGSTDDLGQVRVGERVYSNDYMPEGEPPNYMAGRNIASCLVDSNGRRLTHRDFLARKEDSIFYGWIIRTIASLPDMAHEMWWEAVDRIQQLRVGERSQKALVEPLYKAHIFDKMDRVTLHNVGVTLNNGGNVSAEAINVNLPVAIGRLMGLSLPTVVAKTDAWENQYYEHASEINEKVADATTSLLSILKLMAKHPESDGSLRPLAIEKQEFLEDEFEEIQAVKGMETLHCFVENCAKAGWY